MKKILKILKYSFISISILILLSILSFFGLTYNWTLNGKWYVFIIEEKINLKTFEKDLIKKNYCWHGPKNIFIIKNKDKFYLGDPNFPKTHWIGNYNLDNKIIKFNTTCTNTSTNKTISFNMIDKHKTSKPNSIIKGKMFLYDNYILFENVSGRNYIAVNQSIGKKILDLVRIYNRKGFKVMYQKIISYIT